MSYVHHRYTEIRNSWGRMYLGVSLLLNGNCVEACVIRIYYIYTYHPFGWVAVLGVVLANRCCVFREQEAEEGRGGRSRGLPTAVLRVVYLTRLCATCLKALLVYIHSTISHSPQVVEPRVCFLFFSWGGGEALKKSVLDCCCCCPDEQPQPGLSWFRGGALCFFPHPPLLTAAVIIS